MLENVREAARGRDGPARDCISTMAGPGAGGRRGVLKRMVIARRVLGNMLGGCPRGLVYVVQVERECER